jgi:hypothetical protein
MPNEAAELMMMEEQGGSDGGQETEAERKRETEVDSCGVCV